MINIKSDSRKIKPGDIFVALDGISSNGSDYIDSAIKLGASKIVTNSGNYSVPTIIVDDTRKYLNEYLKENYGHILSDMTIIGFTGTNGKTTTAYLAYESLNAMHMKCAYIGTLGFYLNKKVLTLPNTSCDICDLYDMLVTAYEKGYKYVSVEVSSQGLAYDRFNGIRFDYAVFTNLTQDHLDFHKTMENYAKAKQDLFKKLKENGIGLVNNDDEYKKYFEIGNYKTYGFSESDYTVTNYKLNHCGSTFDISYNGKTIKINSPFIGKYNIYNVLSLVALLKEMNIDDDKIERLIPLLKSPDGRMEIIKYENNSIIIDYAHTPDAMENIFKTVKEICSGKIYTVFGCTGDRDRKKRPVMLKLSTTYSNHTISTSDDLHNEEFIHIVTDMITGCESDNYEVIQDRKKAIERGISLLNKNDMLLILGKGHESFIIVKDKKIPFNDRCEVLKLIDKVTI